MVKITSTVLFVSLFASVLAAPVFETPEPRRLRVSVNAQFKTRENNQNIEAREPGFNPGNIVKTIFKTIFRREDGSLGYARNVDVDALDARGRIPVVQRIPHALIGRQNEELEKREPIINPTMTNPAYKKPFWKNTIVYRQEGQDLNAREPIISPPKGTKWPKGVVFRRGSQKLEGREPIISPPKGMPWPKGAVFRRDDQELEAREPFVQTSSPRRYNTIRQPLAVSREALDLEA